MCVCVLVGSVGVDVPEAHNVRLCCALDSGAHVDLHASQHAVCNLTAIILSIVDMCMPVACEWMWRMGDMGHVAF